VPAGKARRGQHCNRHEAEEEKKSAEAHLKQNVIAQAVNKTAGLALKCLKGDRVDEWRTSPAILTEAARITLIRELWQDRSRNSGNGRSGRHLCFEAQASRFTAR
jgi:hypothetical protein